MNTQRDIPTAPEVQLRLTLPQPSFDRYKELAAAAGKDVEDYISEHLKQTVEHDHSGAGLHFNRDLAVELCALTGRGMCSDPATVLARLRGLVSVRIDGRKAHVIFDAQTLERISHNMRVRRGLMTAEDFIAKEAMNGVRVAVGLSPK